MSRLKSNSRKTFLFKAFLVTILLPLIISPLHFIKVRNIECGTESDYCLENIDKYKAKYENTSLFSAKRMLEKELIRLVLESK